MVFLGPFSLGKKANKFLPKYHLLLKSPLDPTPVLAVIPFLSASFLGQLEKVTYTHWLHFISSHSLSSHPLLVSTLRLQKLILVKMRSRSGVHLPSVSILLELQETFHTLPPPDFSEHDSPQSRRWALCCSRPSRSFSFFSASPAGPVS